MAALHQRRLVARAQRRRMRGLRGRRGALGAPRCGRVPPARRGAAVAAPARPRHSAPAATNRTATIPDTEIQVPRDVETEPPALVRGWTTAAQRAVATYTARWQRAAPAATGALLDWLSTDAPPLVIVARGRTLWDPMAPERLGPLRTELKRCSGAAVRDIACRSRVVADRTRRFRRRPQRSRRAPARRRRGAARLRLHAPRPRPAGLRPRRAHRRPPPRPGAAVRARHARRARRARVGPPRGRCRLGAAGRFPRPSARARLAALVALLDAVDRRCPADARAVTASDLAALTAEGRGSAGAALAQLLVQRMPDFQSNLLAAAASSTRPSARRTCGRTSARCAASTRRRAAGACSSATSTSSSTCASAPSPIRAGFFSQHLVRRRPARRGPRRSRALRHARRRRRRALRRLCRRRREDRSAPRRSSSSTDEHRSQPPPAPMNTKPPRPENLKQRNRGRVGDLCSSGGGGWGLCSSCLSLVPHAVAPRSLARLAVTRRVG